MPGTLRVGVIGCGTIAYWAHLRLLARMDGVELVAAADPDPRARDAAARLVKRPVFERAEDIFARNDIDAVVICAPTHLHHELALAACAAHKHFFLEKPLATDLQQGRQVLAAAAKAGVITMMGFNRRFHPVIEQARAIIAQGRVGRVHAVQIVSCEPPAAGGMPEWRKHRASGGGVLLELASHHIDLLRWLLDDEVGQVEARITSQTTDADSAWLRLTMVRGVEVQSFFSFRPSLGDSIQLLGEGGSLRIDRSRQTPEFRVARRFGYGSRRLRSWPRIANLRWCLGRLARPSYDPSRRRALKLFVALTRGESVDAPTLEDGMRSLEVVLAAEKSAREGQPVSLESNRACVSS
jgi:myo-inositol 2-dehydrogenase/D-chiro-inositol 1-dehydrogenase